MSRRLLLAALPVLICGCERVHDRVLEYAPGSVSLTVPDSISVTADLTPNGFHDLGEGIHFTGAPYRLQLRVEGLQAIPLESIKVFGIGLEGGDGPYVDRLPDTLSFNPSFDNPGEHVAALFGIDLPYYDFTVSGTLRISWPADRVSDHEFSIPLERAYTERDMSAATERLLGV